MVTGRALNVPTGAVASLDELFNAAAMHRSVLFTDELLLGASFVQQRPFRGNKALRWARRHANLKIKQKGKKKGTNPYNQRENQ